MHLIWRRKREIETAIRNLKDGMDECETIKRYHVRNEKIYISESNVEQ